MDFKQTIERLTKATEKQRGLPLSQITEVKTEDLRELIYHFNRIDKELREQEQNFKQKEFEYRTQCQNVVSAARLEADDMPDRLAELEKLEKLVLDYCLDRGYEIGKGEWWFEIDIATLYEWKLLVVKFTDENKHPKPELFYQSMSVTTKEMWDKAIKHFSLKTEPSMEDTKLELDDTNQSAIYKIAGYESDGRE